MRLFSWAEKGPEPLRTYAIGLLAAAMDIPEIAASFRDHNAHLVPIMLKRLWELKDEGIINDVILLNDCARLVVVIYLAHNLYTILMDVFFFNGAFFLSKGGGVEDDKGSGSKVPDRPFAHLNNESISARSMVNGEDPESKEHEEGTTPKKMKG